MNEIREKIKEKIKETISINDIYKVCYEADKRACDSYWPEYVVYDADLGKLKVTDTAPKYLGNEEFYIYKAEEWDAADVDWEDFCSRAEAAGYGDEYQAFRDTDDYAAYREEVFNAMDTDVNPVELMHHLEDMILARVLVGSYSPEWIEEEE